MEGELRLVLGRPAVQGAHPADRGRACGLMDQTAMQLFSHFLDLFFITFPPLFLGLLFHLFSPIFFHLWEWGEGKVHDRGPEQGVSLGRGRVQREGVWGPWGNFLPEALERRVGGLRGWGTEELVGLGAEAGGFILQLQAEVFPEPARKVEGRRGGGWGGGGSGALAWWKWGALVGVS